jgi:hypothetical protein
MAPAERKLIMLRPLFACIALLPLLAAAEIDSPPPAGMKDSEKIDSIFVMQKQVLRTVKNDPLADKRFGVEANLARLLYTGDDAFSFSGGVSLFAVERHSEIAFPFLYYTAKTSASRADGTTYRDDFNLFTQDAHYRYFLGNTQNGFYLSGFARYAHLSGIKGDLFDFLDSTATNAHGTEDKLGAGVGLGYRIFSYRGLYWGCGASFGRYFVGDNDQFRGSFGLFDDGEYIFDVELLKFGWAF